MKTEVPRQVGTDKELLARNASMALFFTFGLSPFWLYIPRLLMAIVSVRFIRLWQRFPVRGRA